MDNGEKTTCEKCGCDHSSNRAPWVIAATIWNSEPRYSVLTTDRAAFDFFKIDRGYEVMTDWDGRMGTLLVPRDEEEEHDERRRELSKMTVADIRAGKLDWITKLMADFEARRQ